ncbi:hypothetical protein YC2023_065431 [Brassica napus]
MSESTSDKKPNKENHHLQVSTAVNISRRSGKNPSNQSSSCAGVSATSLPINAPDWSKILREEHRVGEGLRMTT